MESNNSLGGDKDNPGEDPPLVPHHLHHPLSYGRQGVLPVVDDVDAGLEVPRGDTQSGHHVLPRHADLVVLAVADTEPGHHPVTNLAQSHSQMSPLLSYLSTPTCQSFLYRPGNKTIRDTKPITITNPRLDTIIII